MTRSAHTRFALRSGDVRLELAPAAGGRIASLSVDGWELLVTRAPGTIDWGAYPMVPWAGRLRDGRLRWRGGDWQFPLTLPPHAIHGTLLRRRWHRVSGRDGGSTAVLDAPLIDPWPFGGRAIHGLRLEPDRLTLTLEVHADRQPMPVIVGWHPWFARRLRRFDGAVSADIELDLGAGAMLVRDPPGIPTRTRVPPPPPPWDDTFVDFAHDPVVSWPGELAVSLHSDDARVWVAFTERRRGICVEPQTGPPDGLNGGPLGEPDVVEPGRPLIATMTLVWRR